MSRIKRRQFLQFAGSTLATVGLSQLDIQNKGDRLAKAIAQGTPRKIALLVGINSYDFAPLYGCLTDVDLQRQLLISRFGFNSKDILALTDNQATRANILAAFEEHLIKQAKPGDVVVFHFSGHGSRVKDPDCDNSQDCLNSTFVPVDYMQPGKSGIVQDIMGHTLFLLMSALKTENVTVVLDSCHSGGGTRGNIRVRSRPVPAGSPPQVISAEKEYQQQWLSRLNLSPQEFIQKRKTGVAKGVVLAAARSDQTAADANLGDFSAGAFTYTMTQYLWQQTGNAPFGNILPNIARNITKLSTQQPQIEAQPSKDYLRQPVYFIGQQTPPAEAIITKVEGNRAELWLGGLDQQSLVAFNKDATLTVVDSQGKEKGVVQLESRQGLIGRGKFVGTPNLSSLQPGAFLQERARGIPSNLTLKIGLDPSLGNDMQAAKQALQAIQRIEAVPLQQTDVQYIFGRVTPANRLQILASNLPDTGSLGLFSPDLTPVPNSFGAADETVTDAVTRLRAKVRSLLAARIIKTTLNPNSSRLNVTASMRPAGGSEILASTFTSRSIGKGSGSNKPIAAPDGQKLPLKTSVQLQITNNETSDLYCSIMVIDPTGEISVIFPNQWKAADDVTKIGTGQTKQIPDSKEDNFDLVTQEPKGVAEVLIIASRTPLTKALQSLREVASRGNQGRGPVALNDPTEVVGNLLDDLNKSDRGSNSSSSSDRVNKIDTTQLATLSITFEVI